jgi:hypothetical protein
MLVLTIQCNDRKITKNCVSKLTKTKAKAVLQIRKKH